MAEARNQPAATAQGVGDARNEALAALQLWQTYEYLSPQNPPAPEVAEDICVWALDPQADGHDQMPWIDPKKIDALDRCFKYRRRFMLYAGLIGGKELVETARDLLGAEPLDFSEQRAPESAASFVIPLDAKGCVNGDVFISTVPWAMACLEASRGRTELFNFTGFFGDDGVQQRVQKAVSELLTLRRLVKNGQAENSEGPPAGVGLDEGVEVDPMQAVEPAQSNGDPFDNDADGEDEPRTLEPDDVRAIADVVFASCGWRPADTPDWIIQAQRAPSKNQDRVSDDPLNSFYAEELEKVQTEYLAGRCGATLKQYLEAPTHPERRDLEKTRDHLVDGVHPSRTPPACWPGTHPLVTAQQFAVNAIMGDLRQGGLFSVNGPPGTGKTTMLKDLLAAIVVERADALASFAKPADAFPNRLSVERHQYPVWQLHERLRGFGLVVACANNGAAENISKDLPGMSAIDGAMNLNYFSEVADSLGLPKGTKRRPQKRWGLVSAALGKAENKFAFATDFWDGRKDEEGKDKKKGSRPAQAQDQPQSPPDPLRPLTLQHWVEEFGPSVPSWEQARKRYEEARTKASEALAHVGKLADRLRANEQLEPRILDLQTQHGDLTATIADLARQEGESKSAIAAALDRVERAKAVASTLQLWTDRQRSLEAAQQAWTGVLQRQPSHSLEDLTESMARLERARARVKEDMEAHDHAKPGVIAAFFNRTKVERWEDRRDDLSAELDAKRRQHEATEQARGTLLQWQRDASKAQGKLVESQAQVDATRSAMQKLKLVAGITRESAALSLREGEQDLARLRDGLSTVRARVVRLEAELRGVASELNDTSTRFSANQKALTEAGLLDALLPAWHLFDVPRDEFHKAAPYHDSPQVFHARRDLFAAALELHKAFIVHAWQRLKPTLYVSIGLLTGRFHPSQIHGGPMPLWDALFLVVPLVSTTFASFPRLFRGVGKEQLAWVLIDEAGQAAPQYCAGALWRAKRAVIVGDPLQLEPVVGIPVELADPLRERCGTATRYVPPEASAQTLADLSNRFGTYLNADDPERRIWLGSPLTVHRRCIAPMFDIANSIAYEDNMVYGAGADRAGETAPTSQWLDASNEGNVGHWVPVQGKRALTAIQTVVKGQLRNEEGKLRAFVITPFTSVAERMRKLLASEYSWSDAKEMCGTVHTFQGKEADYVVFLLGGDPNKPGVISSFAGRNPNLINVAVTRAKKRLYVFGNLDFWTGPGDRHGYYRHMAETLKRHLAAEKAKAKGDVT